jgi:hypothetical protein
MKSSVIQKRGEKVCKFFKKHGLKNTKEIEKHWRMPTSS